MPPPKPRRAATCGFFFLGPAPTAEQRLAFILPSAPRKRRRNVGVTNARRARQETGRRMPEYSKSWPRDPAGHTKCTHRSTRSPLWPARSQTTTPCVFVALTDHTRPSIPDSPLPRCSHTPARRPKCTTGHRAERHAKTRWVRSQIGSSGHAAEILRVVWAGARGRADGRRNTHVRKTRPNKVPAPFRIQNIPSRQARVQH